MEGKFGQGKRRFSQGRIMAKLAQTSEVAIMISFIVMNLEKILAGIVSFWLLVRHLLSVQMRRDGLKRGNRVLDDYQVAA